VRFPITWPTPMIASTIAVSIGLCKHVLNEAAIDLQEVDGKPCFRYPKR
jgi:hypothetical protein